MHELGLCEGIVEAATRRAAGRRVRGLRVRVGGQLADQEVIRQGVAVAAMGTVAEGADVDLVLEPLLARCRDCGHDAPVAGAAGLAACPCCHGVDVEVTGSEQVILESVTLEAPVAAPAGAASGEPRS